MSTVVLSAASPALPSLGVLSDLLLEELRRRQQEVRLFELAETKLAYCQGEFDCWIKTPGKCRSHDAEQSIVEAIHDAESLVLLDSVTFGGHSYTVKRAQDRLICLLTPFFEKRLSLTHHGHRYDKSADLRALGWMTQGDPQQAQTWAALASANGVNMLAPHEAAEVVDDSRRDLWRGAIERLLDSHHEPGSEIHGRPTLREALLDAAQPASSTPPSAQVHRAALLVGSAKHKGTSASEGMARRFARILEQQGVTTELHFATEFVREGRHAHGSAQAIAAADLFLLVTPLYVDALPALTTHALEMVAAARKLSDAPGRFALVINCGFPEPEQNRTAVRIARHFADAANYHWTGALPLGGGGVINPGVPIEEQHGPVEHIKQAIDLAAPALARGQNVPSDALAAMMKSPMPDALYRLVGDLGFRYEAHKHGLAQRSLRARPLD